MGPKLPGDLVSSIRLLMTIDCGCYRCDRPGLGKSVVLGQTGRSVRPTSMDRAYSRPHVVRAMVVKVPSKQPSIGEIERSDGSKQRGRDTCVRRAGILRIPPNLLPVEVAGRRGHGRRRNSSGSVRTKEGTTTRTGRGRTGGEVRGWKEGGREGGREQSRRECGDESRRRP
ncbi:hypothetical protein MPTK1_2g15180 [Marchantia polymorpha subsp. ruderalis]|uniref:Uncharacterized protein n=1 Tax=Marchantia polymorpha TaxID=3197 RepID=A0A2R6WJW7_MARPO|nr:hypothetical protein MARPO_0082s0014 [Marchantia polymorpha]BBN02415.1 hypothetical protein Mp_2g15180 [Marchantia polymorpha subsp. ruderalis]|eukprot:PTQ34158.1 hypothetical protein MARPO_0082s0014 [Marchantia polymorpha]